MEIGDNAGTPLLCPGSLEGIGASACISCAGLSSSGFCSGGFCRGASGGGADATCGGASSSASAGVGGGAGAGACASAGRAAYYHIFICCVRLQPAKLNPTFIKDYLFKKILVISSFRRLAIVNLCPVPDWILPFCSFPTVVRSLAPEQPTLYRSICAPTDNHLIRTILPRAGGDAVNLLTHFSLLNLLSLLCLLCLHITKRERCRQETNSRQTPVC